MNNRHGKDRIYYPSEKASPPKRVNSNSGIVGDSLQALAVSSSSTVRRNISLPSMDHGLDKQPCGTPMQQGNRKTGNLVPLSVSGFGQGLSPRQLCMILPYHIVVDSHFNVLQFGNKLSFLKPANKNKASSKYRSEQSSSENYIGKYFDLISAHVESPLGGSLALVGHEDIDHGGGSTTAAVAGLEWRRLRAGPDSCYELQLKDRFIRRIEHQEQQTQAQTQGQLAPSCLSSPMSVQSMGSASSAGSVSSAGVSRYSSIRSDFAGTGAAATSQSAAISALRAESTDSAQLSSVPRNASAASAASSLPCTYATSDTVTAVRLIGELRMLGGDDEEKASSASLLTALSRVEGAVGVPYAILLLRPAPPDRTAPSQACAPAGTDPAADPHKAGSELYRSTSDSNPSGVTTSGSGTIWSTGSVSGACMGGGSVGGDCPSFSGSSPTSISSASAPVPLLGQFSRANSSTSTCSITSTVTSTPVGHAILQQQLQQRVLALEEENMRLLEQLQLQARRQEQSSALPKDAVTMLGNVAHDLKTPLAAFLGGLDLIEDAVQDSEARVRAAAATAAATTSTAINSTPKSSVRNTAGDGAGGPTGGATKQALRKVQKSLQFVVSETDTVRGITNFMKMTINRCIDYTKSTQGLKLVPKNETFRLHEDGLRLPIHCMRAVQSKLPIRLHAHAAQHHCGHGQGSSQGPSGQSQSTLVCSHIISDRLWLQENLLCLLSNAVKYSFDGSIDVRLSLLPEAFTVSEAQVQLEKGTTAGAGAGDEWTVEALRAAGFPAVTYPVTATAAGNDTRSRNDGDKAVGGSSSDVQAAPVPVLTARKLAAIHAQALPRARQQRQEQAAAEARMPLMRRHTMRSGSYIGHNHTQQQPQDVGDISCPSAGAGAGMPIDSRTSCPAAISASPSASLGTKHRGGPRTPQRLAPIDSCSPGAKSPGQSPGQGEEQRFSPDGRVGAAPLLSSHPTSQEGSPCKVSSLTSMLSDLGLESGGAATGSSTNGSSNATHSNLSSGSGTPSAPVYLPSSAAALASALAPVVTGPPHACGSNSISSCSTSSSSGFTTRSSVSGGFGSSSGRGLSEGIALRPDLLSSHSLSFSAASSSSALGGVGVGGGFLLSASASGSFCANANANASATSSAVSRRPSGLNLSGKVFGRELMLKIGEDQELEAKSDSSSGDGGGGDRAPTRSPVDDRLETALVPPLLVVEVEDSGIGLQEETMDQLFTPFKQAQRLAGGTGLGLYSLSKRLDALGGFYGVEGRRDGKQGSVFWFAIPYRADSNAAADAARAAAKAAARDAARAAAKKQQLQQQQQQQQQQQLSSVLVSQRGLVPDGGGGGQLVDKAPLAAVKEGIAEEEDQGAATSPAKHAAKHITVRTQGDSASHTSPPSPLPLAPAQVRMRGTQSSTSHTGSSSGNDSTSSFHSASASASTSLSMSGSASPAVAAARRPRSGVPPINTSAAVAAANISPQRCGRSGASRASGGVDKAIYLSPRPPSAMNSPTSNSAKGSRGFFRSSAAGASVGSFHSSSNNSSSSDGLSACSAGSLFSAAGIPLSPRVRSSCAEGAAATISPKQDQQIRAMMRQGAGIAVTSPTATSGIARVSSSSSMISTGSVGTPRSNLAQNILRADSSMSGGGGSQSARRLCGVRPLRLLVVDDSEPIMKITCAVLRRQGHHVDQASNGLQALERIYALQQLQEQQGLQQQQRSHTAAGARPGAGTVPDVRDEMQSPILGKGGVGTGLVVVRGYDVVLMDLQMPVLDGLEAIVRLRATEMERETGRLVGGEVVPTGAVKPTGQEEVSVSTDSGEETGKVAATAGAASAETTVSVAALSASTAIEYRRQLVVGLSANGDNDTAQAAFDAGADDFMVKPFNLLQFYEIYSAATATNTATATAAASASKDC